MYSFFFSESAAGENIYIVWVNIFILYMCIAVHCTVYLYIFIHFYIMIIFWLLPKYIFGREGGGSL